MRSLGLPPGVVPLTLIHSGRGQNCNCNNLYSITLCPRVLCAVQRLCTYGTESQRCKCSGMTRSLITVYGDTDLRLFGH